MNSENTRNTADLTDVWRILRLTRLGVRAGRRAEGTAIICTKGVECDTISMLDVSVRNDPRSIDRMLANLVSTNRTVVDMLRDLASIDRCDFFRDGEEKTLKLGATQDDTQYIGAKERR